MLHEVCCGCISRCPQEEVGNGGMVHGEGWGNWQIHMLRGFGKPDELYTALTSFLCMLQRLLTQCQ